MAFDRIPLFLFMSEKNDKFGRYIQILAVNDTLYFTWNLSSTVYDFVFVSIWVFRFICQFHSIACMSFKASFSWLKNEVEMCNDTNLFIYYQNTFFSSFSSSQITAVSFLFKRIDRVVFVLNERLKFIRNESFEAIHYQQHISFDT